jgi:CheY-like chemotaxis protein
MDLAARPILVVEDDDNSRLMMATLLEAKGYPVVTAANGAEALAMARQYRPCLILLDLIMPVMDGLQFRAEQLADSGLSSIPVVVVSGRYNAAELAGELGAVCLIVKPITMDLVLEAVRPYGELVASAPAISQAARR